MYLINKTEKLSCFMENWLQIYLTHCQHAEMLIPNFEKTKTNRALSDVYNGKVYSALITASLCACADLTPTSRVVSICL